MRVFEILVQVNELANLQHKVHLDKKLDKVLQMLQAQSPDVEAINQKLQAWKDWVKYCKSNPGYVFKQVGLSIRNLFGNEIKDFN